MTCRPAQVYDAGRVRPRVLAVLVVFGLFCAGCPTVDLGETPVSPGSCRPDPAYFEDVVWPEFLAPDDPARSCVGESGCHRLEDGRSAFRLSTTSPIDFPRNYDVTARFLNCGTPEASSALTKPLSGVDPHGGGDLIDPGSNAEMVFLEWFAL